MSGVFITNGQLDANITTTSNLRGALSLNGTVPGNIGFPATRQIKIAAGIQANAAPVTLSGQFRGQGILNTQNGTQVWSSSVTLNGQTLNPDANFEFTQTSAQLGGGAFGMAPFRLWKTDCLPPWEDNTSLGAGDGLFEAALNDPAQRPIKLRFYGPVVRGSAYATWQDAFYIECRPLGVTGTAQCEWIDATNAFVIDGPSTSTTDVTDRRTISIGRQSGYFPRPGIYRVIPKMGTGDVINSVLSADVTGNPPTRWPTACGVSPDGSPDPAPAYVFRIKPDCDANGIEDEFQTPTPTCNTNCHIGDVNGTGSVTVQDIFDFLGFYFAADPRADVNGVGGVTVQDIFDFLAIYFSCS